MKNVRQRELALENHTNRCNDCDKSFDTMLNLKGHIKTVHVKKIALRMNHGVYSVFEKNHRKHTCEDTFRLMLDHWWEQYLHRPDLDALQEFVQI